MTLLTKSNTSNLPHSTLVTSPHNTLEAALIPQRSLWFFTVTATVPIAVLIMVLLLTRSSARTLGVLSMIGGIVAIVGFGELLYELTMDIAGFPDFHLPAWAVFYLVVYLITGFTFLFFGIHIRSPGEFGGFEGNNKAAFLDALYVSLCNFVGSSPGGGIRFRTQFLRFMVIIESLLSMFVTVVILTKFVNVF